MGVRVRAVGAGVWGARVCGPAAADARGGVRACGRAGGGGVRWVQVRGAGRWSVCDGLAMGVRVRAVGAGVWGARVCGPAAADARGGVRACGCAGGGGGGAHIIKAAVESWSVEARRCVRAGEGGGGGGD